MRREEMPVAGKAARQIVVIGGGAAGFFAALTCARLYPGHKVRILEKTTKLLAKVKISGGGRCNVSHACYQARPLAAHYPRGEKPLRPLLPRFMPQDTLAWFEERGVPLKTEADGRIFPLSDQSQSVIDCFMEEARRFGVDIQTQAEVKKIIPREPEGFHLHLATGKILPADRVIVATGGSPKLSGLDWLTELGHTVCPPVPSLFTFNLPQHPLAHLAGVAVPEAEVRVVGTKLRENGPLLITHWGLSGPAILRLSAWGARLLAEKNYDFAVMVVWQAAQKEKDWRDFLAQQQKESPRRQVKNLPVSLPQRLWESLLAGIGAGVAYGSLILCLDRLDRARPGTSAVKIVLINNLGSTLPVSRPSPSTP
ncbi:MAG: aminoacetone oxidase family FAD-binding enzyme, partial [Microscillaceae bacterium]|nr:aminoacetone oxidase family FAD-binding enzyme [Microscillaceae bacterium]